MRKIHIFFIIVLIVAVSMVACGDNTNNKNVVAQNGEDGKDGIDGKDGTNGKDGKDGINGKDGTNGKDGKDGKDGVSIENVSVNSDGELIVTLTDGTIKNAGKVKGEDGQDGKDAPGTEYTSLENLPYGTEISVEPGNSFVFELSDGQIVHVNNITFTYVEKYEYSQVDTSEERKQIMGTSSDLVPEYRVDIQAEGYIENYDTASKYLNIYFRASASGLFVFGPMIPINSDGTFNCIISEFSMTTNDPVVFRSMDTFKP